MDLMDEYRAALAYQAAHGFPRMPDRPAPGPGARGANWSDNLSPAEVRALDRATSEGARNGAYAIGSVRAGNVHGGDWPRAMPETEEAARLMRDELDARVAWAEARDPGNRQIAWARESARRGTADRERHEAERREAGRKAFADRVEAEVERRLRETGKA